MGEVYRARDTTLQREVALKFLPSAIERDPEQLARFQREARLLASLNHPNIGAIHGFEEIDGLHFLVLELVPGVTLEAMLARGPLDRVSALRIMEQVAHALEAAHNAGIAHRDLKPGNIMITGNGKVKVLDFGLAKALDQGELPEAATMTSNTIPGHILGTPAYMSPERLRGEPADKRADIWAFGCTLYEALSGAKPFAGRTTADTLASVLDREPQWNKLPPSTPAEVQRLLRHCLEKDPGRRLRDAGDLRVQLENAQARSSQGRSIRPAWLVPALLIASIALVVIAWRFVQRGAESALPHPILSQVTFAEGIEEYPAWSPDGKQIAYAAQSGQARKILRKDLASGQDVQVTHGDYDELQPAWSPDGLYILFIRARQPNQKLQPGDVFGQFDEADVWRFEVASGRESKLIENAFNPAYSFDGKRIAVDASWAGPRRIWIVDSEGHNPQQATTDTSEEVAHVAPQWSPDGNRIVFQNIARTKFDIRVVALASKQMSWISNDFFENLRPAWAPSGKFIYFSSAYRGGGWNIWRARVSSDGSVDGSLQQVTTGSGQDLELAISRDGKRIAFAILRQNADIWRLPVSPQTGMTTGEPEQVIGTTREDSRGTWSPDQSAIAFNSDRGGDMNIWVYSLKDGSTRQVTTGRGGDFQANWSPDAKKIAFFSSRSGTPNIWIADTATGKLAQLTKNSGININPFFSPDGSRIVYQSDRSGRNELWMMSSDGSGQHRLTNTGAAGHFIRWIDSGDAIIFRCLCGGKLATMKISVNGGEPQPFVEQMGGSHMSFSPDRSRIMDVVGHQVLWVTPLQGARPQKVFEFSDASVRIDYPVWSPDGKWVLFDRLKPQGGDIWMMEGFE
jgi:Tol biopolymer transport system component